MSKLKIREQAILLRKQKKSYSQIKKIIPVSKSTLSNWLRNYPLSKKIIIELRDVNESRIEKFRETMKRKHEIRLNKIYYEESKKILPLSKRELFIAGLFLYWGEGSKGPYMINISNSDPKMINFSMYWFVNSLQISKNKIRVCLQLYKDMNIKEEIKYWSKKLDMPLSSFRKPYIKKTARQNINHKGGYGHGTCNLVVGNVILKERIMIGIKSICDYYKIL